MAGTSVKIPDFDFSGFYYPEILQALILFKRRNVPELSDESDFEPLMQMLRAFALVGHLNNVLIDLIANESTLPTAKLAETVRNMLRLIGYEMRSATPSQVEMIYKVATTFPAPGVEVVPFASQVATRRGDADTSVIYFESDDSVEITERTDLISIAYTTTGEGLGGAVVGADYSTQAKAGTPWNPWGNVAPNHMLYIGHPDVMFDALDITVPSSPNHISLGVWEFYDGDTLDTKPDDVTNVGGGQLRFNVNDLLGTVNRKGAVVRVQYDETTASEDVTSDWDGTSNFVTTSLLGQSAPSLSSDSYTVGVDWQELDEVVDETTNLAQDGVVRWALPQTQTKTWRTTTPPSVAGDWFMVRFRVIEVIGATAPSISLVDITAGDHYVTVNNTQGRSVRNETLGSSNGDASQQFRTAQEQFIDGSEVVRVSSLAWTKVLNFLNSEAQSEHYRVELSDNNRAVIVFGDGVKGKIPPIGQGNLTVDYRYNAEADGNVGALTVVVDKQGLTYVDRVFNPRAGAGWSEAQDASEESLEAAKEEGPATLRNKEVALGPQDCEELALAFTDGNGSKPFGRARAIEEGFGPKTVKLVVVAKGGGLATAAQLLAADEYFNGDRNDPTKPKRLVTNQQLTSVNYTPRIIDLALTVYAPSDLTEDQVKNKLDAILQPEAKQDDGVTLLWNFGGTVARSQIEAAVHSIDPRIARVDLPTFTIVTLSALELPNAGTFTVTLVRI